MNYCIPIIRNGSIKKSDLKDSFNKVGKESFLKRAALFYTMLDLLKATIFNDIFQKIGTTRYDIIKEVK